jgi:hypothetical protein
MKLFGNIKSSIAAGCVESRRMAYELDSALAVLSKYDEGPDLVLYCNYWVAPIGQWHQLAAPSCLAFPWQLIECFAVKAIEFGLFAGDIWGSLSVYSRTLADSHR